jgi:hypothetical protein
MITLDDSRWPLVMFIAKGSLSESQFDSYLGLYSRILSRGERYVAIFDAREAKPMDVQLVKRQARWIDENAEALVRCNVGIAFVIPSPMIRGVFKAILWIRPMPQPYVVLNTMQEAADWASRKLRDAGLQVPDLTTVAGVAAGSRR